MFDQLFFYVIFPLVVGGILAVFTAIYNAFAKLAAKVDDHAVELAEHRILLNIHATTKH